jgi:sarcosine oxidase, subunit gamma
MPPERECMVKLMPERWAVLRVQSWDMNAVVPIAVQSVLSLAWPQSIGAVSGGRADVICIGPTEWLMITSAANPVPLLQSVLDSFQNSSFRATDVSSALARIDIEGPHARRLLSKACSLDVHPSKLPPGRAARTRFAGIPVVVHCRQESVMECIVTLSYRDYLLAWLRDAAMEL